MSTGDLILVPLGLSFLVCFEGKITVPPPTHTAIYTHQMRFFVNNILKRTVTNKICPEYCPTMDRGFSNLAVCGKITKMAKFRLEKT